MAAETNRPIVVVFDGDDTLWSTERLYDEARSRARRLVVDAGLDGEHWERLERRFDVDNVAPLGFSVDRFPTSCVQAYEALCDLGRMPVDSGVRERVRDAARSVFSSRAPLLPGARETLERLRARGVRLALLTKGDPGVQQGRIGQSGIAGAFDNIRVVMTKTPTMFAEIAAALGAAPYDAWSVGNSIQSDIVPALQAGLHAIWIDAHVWEHERCGGDVDNSVVKAHHLGEIPELIERARPRERISAAL